MTDTTNIRNAIKRLPNQRDVDCTPEVGRTIQFGITDELKALVAENESLKAEVKGLREALKWVRDESDLNSQDDIIWTDDKEAAIDYIHHRCIDALTTHGGNDD